MKPIKNVSASVHQRLLNRAKSDKRPFNDAKQVQWTAFRKRLQQDHIPASFRDIVEAVEAFLAPLASSLAQGSPNFLAGPLQGHGPDSAFCEYSP